MKRKFRKNQIIISALAVMIAVAGYLSFTNKEVSIIDENGNPITVSQDEELQETIQTDGGVDDGTAYGEETGSTSDGEMSWNESDVDGQEADEEFADGGELAAEEDAVLTGADGNSDDAPVSAPVNDSIGEAVLTNAAVTSNAIINAKLNREQTRSKSQELLMQLVNNESLDDETKQGAVAQLVAMTERMEKESSCEQQLLAKGFGECVVLINDDSVDVTVNRQELSEVEKAQIEDIITRKAECDMSQVVITMVTGE